MLKFLWFLLKSSDFWKVIHDIKSSTGKVLILTVLVSLGIMLSMEELKLLLREGIVPTLNI